MIVLCGFLDIGFSENGGRGSVDAVGIAMAIMMNACRSKLPVILVGRAGCFCPTSLSNERSVKGKDMDKDTLAFLHYCLSLLDMLSNSSLSYMDDVQINANMMTFTGKYTDAFIFDSDWLNCDYQHHTTVVGMNCDFYVIRQHH